MMDPLYDECAGCGCIGTGADSRYCSECRDKILGYDQFGWATGWVENGFLEICKRREDGRWTAQVCGEVYSNLVFGRTMKQAVERLIRDVTKLIKREVAKLENKKRRL